uniref:Uncharacterized protein n=1 Tax=Terrapene triunguis TaxID=2587831 RepID=A0A674IQ90_9SAUR
MLVPCVLCRIRLGGAGSSPCSCPAPYSTQCWEKLGLGQLGAPCRRLIPKSLGTSCPAAPPGDQSPLMQALSRLTLGTASWGPQGWLCAGSWLPSPWGRVVGGHEPLLSPGPGCGSASPPPSPCHWQTCPRQGSLDLQSPATFHCVPDSSKQGELGSMQTKPAVPACPLPCRPLPGRCPLARSPPRLLQIPLPTECGPQKPGDTRLVQWSGPE